MITIVIFSYIPSYWCQVENDDDNSDDEDDDSRDGIRSNDSSEMMIDEPESLSSLSPIVRKAEAEDGWTVVGSRRSRGKRN